MNTPLRPVLPQGSVFFCAAVIAGAAALSGCDRAAAPEAPASAEAPPASTAPSAPVPDNAAPGPEASSAPSSDAPLQGGGDDWRAVATPADVRLLDRLDQAWTQARAEAEASGFADEVQSLGTLADPAAGQVGRLQPPPGDYRCRSIRLGARDQGAGGLAYSAYPAFRCRVELTPGGDLILQKTTGSQRTRGLLYPDSDRRLVYVGAQAWGDESGFPVYGARTERDQLGVFERIGPQRWRLVIPFPKQESKLEILELTR